jgi:hypothetical protein
VRDTDNRETEVEEMFGKRTDGDTLQQIMHAKTDAQTHEIDR